MTGDPWEQYWDRPGVLARPLALTGEEEPRRPERPVRVPFDVCFSYEYDSGLAPYAGRIVPIEHVRPGDVQVVVQGRIGTSMPDDPVALDHLASMDGLASIVVDRPVKLTRPLPAIRELLVTSGVDGPDEATLANLPGLRRLCHGRSPGSSKVDLRTLARMSDLEDLRFHAAAVPTIVPISELTRLRRLRIEDHTFESIAPLAAATALRFLAIGWWRGMNRLASLSALERVELNEGTVSSLRQFTGWRALRSLTVHGQKLRSLEGIDGFTSLEDLFLYHPAVSDLAPLEDARGVRRLRLDVANRVEDFAPISRLNQLESLIVDFKGQARAAIPRLADLAGLRGLRDVAITAVDGDGWHALLELPGLRRIRLYGSLDAGAPAEFRRRFPDALIDVRPITPTTPPALEIAELADGRWLITGDASRHFGVRDNFEAESRLRERLAATNSELLDRLDFDTDADAMVVRAASEADIRAVARLLG